MFQHSMECEKKREKRRRIEQKRRNLDRSIGLSNKISMCFLLFFFCSIFHSFILFLFSPSTLFSIPISSILLFSNWTCVNIHSIFHLLYAQCTSRFLMYCIRLFRRAIQCVNCVSFENWHKAFHTIWFYLPLSSCLDLLNQRQLNTAGELSGVAHCWHCCCCYCCRC